MNLHISYDDKFLDYFIRDVDRFTNTSNRYIVLTTDGKMRYVKSKQVFPIVINDKNIYKIISDLRQYKLVFLHSLGIDQARIVNKAPLCTKFVWLFYGYEAFTLPCFKNMMYGRETNKAIKKIRCLPGQLRFSINPIVLYRNILNNISQRKFFLEIMTAMRKIDYFAHFIYDDYVLLRKKLGIKAKYIEFNYGTYEDYVDGCDTSYNTKPKNILLGNSASINNNHIEAIKYLNRYNLHNYRIIIPLSYSVNNIYVEYIKTLAKSYFGEHCEILESFIQKNEYNLLISSCGTFLMNQYRSQAGGTNLVAFEIGAKLFMSDKSNMSKFYRELGLRIFSIEKDFIVGRKDIFMPLSENESLSNRIIAKRYFGQCAVEKRYFKMFKKLLG